jgi:hypothetical protein
MSLFTYTGPMTTDDIFADVSCLLPRQVWTVMDNFIQDFGTVSMEK